MPICKIHTGRTVAEAAGLLKDFGEIFIVADANAAEYAGRIAAELPGTRPGEDGILLLEATEQTKTMDTVLHICSWLLRCGADRGALLLAVGGGITTDMAGFAAAIYKRGIRTAYIPTTLLAQTDAAIGGKTGVNLGDYKNMLGVIRQPEFTWICPEPLGTLPYRELLSGAAEMLKTFIIDNSGDNYRKAVKLFSEIAGSPDKADAVRASLSEIMSLAGAAAAIKSGIVERDAFEAGERRKLNLGHTFAHAIEHEARVQGRDITHGEAVAIGIVMAASLSDRHFGTCPEQALAPAIRNDFLACGLPADCPFPLQSLADAMTKDKKAENGMVNFILIRSIGNVQTVPIDAGNLSASALPLSGQH